MRRLAELTVDDIEVDSGAVWARQSRQQCQSSDDDRRVPGERMNLGDTLYDGDHGVTDECDPVTRHGSTLHRVSTIEDLASASHVLSQVKCTNSGWASGHSVGSVSRSTPV